MLRSGLSHGHRQRCKTSMACTLMGLPGYSFTRSIHEPKAEFKHKVALNIRLSFAGDRMSCQAAS